MQWPKEPTRARKQSRFQASYQETLDLLNRELRQLGARDAVIQLALEAKDIRLDGLPRAHARPAHPGVILSFAGRHGPLSFPCDTFADWESNLRAIALALEALRAVDRYGVTQRAEQYRGWAQLGDGGQAADADLTSMILDEAARFVSDHGCGLASGPQVILSNADAFTGWYQNAARRLHPDADTGDHESFVKLQAAAKLLRAHHGI